MSPAARLYSEVTLVRHGQAQSGAHDEESYDRLSDLGVQQAIWLGAYLKETQAGYDQLVSGTLVRQRDTAAELAKALGLQQTLDARLNEFDYFGLAESLKQVHNTPIPVDRPGFMAHVPQVMEAWHLGEISTPKESFSQFEERVYAALEQAEQSGARVLLVTSGGVISMALRIILGLDLQAFSHVLLQVNNTSMHRYIKAGETRLLDGFNATPHLDRADRINARTYI
ncbi:MAG: histidine phosphatase family protein [Paracoccaceae bacterium]